MLFETIILTRPEFEADKAYKGKDGTYRLYDTPLFKAIIKMNNEGDANAYSIQSHIIEDRIPKLPYETLKTIHAFFVQVYDERKSEVAVLLWYNFTTQDWQVEVPKQRVSGASVNYTRDMEYIENMKLGGYHCVGTIHSHCEMGAFHSGTDDKDEYGFDGVHITIGKVKSGPTFAQRILCKDIEINYKSIYDVVEEPGTTIIVPEEWMTQIEEPIVTYHTGKDWWKGYNALDTDVMSILDKRTVIAKLKNGNKKKTKVCPHCLEITKYALHDDFACRNCGLPLYEDPSNYEYPDDEEDKKDEQEIPDDYYGDATTPEAQEFIVNQIKLVENEYLN